MNTSGGSTGVSGSTPEGPPSGTLIIGASAIAYLVDPQTGGALTQHSWPNTGVDTEAYTRAGDGSVYYLNDTDNTLRKLNPDGTEATGGWPASLPGNTEAVLAHPNGSIYVATAGSGAARTVTQYNDAGEQGWSVTDWPNGKPTDLATAGDSGLVVVDQGSYVTDLNAADGTIDWSTSVGGNLRSVAVASDGSIYAGEFGPQGGDIHRLSAAGADQGWPSNGDDDTILSITASGSTVFVGDQNGDARRFGSDGQQVWETNIGSTTGIGALLLDGSSLYAGGGHMALLDLNGGITWSEPTATGRVWGLMRVP